MTRRLSMKRSALKARAFRARWKRLGTRCPSKTRWLAHQNALNAQRRALDLCPDCGVPTGCRFVYCTMDRVRRAENNARWWRKQKVEKAA